MAEGYGEVQCPGGQSGAGGYPYSEVPCPKERAWSRVVQCIMGYGHTHSPNRVIDRND